jgi:hypothetical protein
MQTKATKINPILHFLTAKHFGFLRHTIFITAVAFIFNIL